MLRALFVPCLAVALCFGVCADAAAQATAETATKGPLWRRPSIEGTDEARAVVVQALQTRGDRVAATVWMERGFAALRDEGWLWARLRADSTAAQLVLRLDPGQRARIGELEIRGDPAELVRAWSEASGVRSESILRPGRWPAQVRRGLRAIAERGHPFANLSVIRRVPHSETGRVDLLLNLSVGEPARIGAVRVEGSTHTRAEVLARMSGLGVGSSYRESDLERARQRLLARDIVSGVESADVRLMSEEEVEVRLQVRQPSTLGRVAAALGVVRQQDEDSRVSGSVDLALLDLFGTARRFEGRWLDDGVSRRRLDLAFTEPLAFGTPLDLKLAVGQRHEDQLYDTVLADVAVGLAWEGARQLQLGLGIDRTTFAGESGRVRLRSRLGAEIGLRRERPSTAGLYGELRTGVEAARVRETFGAEPGEQGASESVSQTLLEADGWLGLAVGRNVAVQTRAAWRSVETEALPLPGNELWAIGGATTVRGYREEQFQGERAAWGGAELVLGPPQRGQGYVFFDLGWVRRTRSVADESLRTEDRWLHGFGVGVRSPTGLGALDLSVGFADRIGFDQGKLHLALTRNF